jgi:hypothetical protein
MIHTYINQSLFFHIANGIYRLSFLTRPTVLARGALDEPELALLGEETSLLEAALLLGSLVLEDGDNASVLVHHEVRRKQPASGLVRASTENLDAGAEELGVLLSFNVVVSVTLALRSVRHLCIY